MLDRAIRGELNSLDGARNTWRSPLREDSYRELRDGAFLDAVRRSELSDALRDFWPRRGPVWGGLATVTWKDGRNGVILVEAKSYPAEMKSGCKATEPARATIEAAIDEARQYPGANNPPVDVWLDDYYQLANRLAHLAWLERHGVPTWFVMLCFVDDHRHVATSEARWRAELARVEEEMGLRVEHLPAVGHVFLPALDRQELLSPATPHRRST